MRSDAGSSSPLADGEYRFAKGAAGGPQLQATAFAMPAVATATMRSISSGVMQYGGMK